MCVAVNSECFYLVQNNDRSLYVKNMKHEFAIEVIAGSSHSQASQDRKFRKLRSYGTEIRITISYKRP